MLRSTFITILAGLLFILGCEEPVDLGLEQDEEQIVVLSEFSTDGPFQVVVTKSNGILSNNVSGEPNYVVDAEVQIFKDGRIVEDLLLTREEGSSNAQKQLLYFRGQDPVRERSGIHEVKVTVPGFKVVSSFDAIPELAAPITCFAQVAYSENTNEIDLKLDFENIETNTYYHLLLSEVIQNLEEGEVSSFSLDYTLRGETPKYLNHFGNGILIKGEDLLFGDNHLNLRARIFLYPELGQRLVAELRTVSQNYYNYHSSLSMQIEQRDSIVSRPVILFNNIENGLGNFAAFISDRDSVILND